MVLKLDDKYKTTYAQKHTRYVLMELLHRYSNKAYGYKNARKNNDTEQMENNKKYTI